MENKQYKHKIGGGVGCGTILVFLMTVGMAALCLWLHKTGNGAILLGRIILAMFGGAFLLSLYHSIFFKVLIDEDGFFYQSAPGNGRYYRYSEIRRAWVSSGKYTNSNEPTYCNYETRMGETVRIPITGADTEAAEYLIKRVETVAASGITGMEDDQRDLLISGKTQGATRFIVLLFIIGIVMWLSFSLAREGLPPITFILPVIASLVALAYFLVKYFYYRIEIRRDGFYCRTNPFNGQFYRYRDITSCKLTEKRKKYGSVHGRGARETHYFYYLVFTDKSRTERKIEYDKSLFEREINILLSRMKQNQS